MAMIFCFYRTQYQLMMEIEQTLATWKFQWRHLVVKLVTIGSGTTWWLLKNGLSFTFQKVLKSA